MQQIGLVKDISKVLTYRFSPQEATAYATNYRAHPFQTKFHYLSNPTFERVDFRFNQISPRGLVFPSRYYWFSIIKASSFKSLSFFFIFKTIWFKLPAIVKFRSFFMMKIVLYGLSNFRFAVG